jgi:hypothetical protein
MATVSLPKSFNYHAVTITGDYALEADSYNVVYGTLLSPSTLHLPDLTDVIDGFPLMVKNYGPADLQIRDAANVFVADLLAGASFTLIANKGLINQWRNVLGPIGGGTGVSVSGPGVSTDNAVVLWNGTSGGFIKNSTLLVDPSSNISGVNDISVAGTASFSSGLDVTAGTLTYTSGSDSTIFANTPSGGTHTWTFRNVNDSVLGLSTTDTLSNKNLLSLTNNIACNYINSATTQVRVDASAAPVSGQVLTAASPTLASWQTPSASLTGPVSSTDSAIALWNGASGALLKNSAVTLDGLGNVGGVNNLTATGDVTADNVLLAGGSLSYVNGGNSLTLSSAPSTTRNLALPDASDTLVGKATSDVFTNKTITSTTNTVYASGFQTTSTPVITDTSAPPVSGQVLVADSTTDAIWTTVGDATYGPNFPSDWVSIPTDVQGAFDGLAATAGNNLHLGVDPGATATGVDQASAYLITRYFTNVTSTPVGTGVLLPTYGGVHSGGVTIIIKNNGGNALLVYPNLGAQINGLGSNVAYNLSSGSSVHFISINGVQWESV